MRPSISLLSSAKPCGSCRLPRTVGICPVRKLNLSTKVCRLDKLPSSLGIRPSRRLSSNRMCIRLVSFPSSVGMVDESLRVPVLRPVLTALLLSWWAKVSQERNVRRPNSLGMAPCDQDSGEFVSVLLIADNMNNETYQSNHSLEDPSPAREYTSRAEVVWCLSDWDCSQDRVE